MHYYIITGASQGLGKALALEALSQPHTAVLGVSRHATIEHARYRHQPLDLSDLTAVQHNLYKIFPHYTDAESITLINNAGVIGEIGYVGEQQNEHYEFVFSINTIAPAMLMNTFLSAYSGSVARRTVLNISSGAAQRPVDGWGAYCASKASLDMLSQVAQKEQDLRGSRVRIRSLAPGVIDTDMQAQIRGAKQSQFSGVSRFITLHKEGELLPVNQVARKIVDWVKKIPSHGESPVLHLQDM
ncbi:SDR family NAD(P)-dependent oxidoreductase [Hymenobacter koreensis]|uniref:(S)-benzoin forming benzil reductase n=1 Tax=Hymenobacter koreensis TaxID=1084523 RepID=A0ABP8IVG3_9BACT